MIRHLLYNTYRSQFGWLWMFWFLCANQALLGLMSPTNDAVQVFRTIFFVAQCFLGAIALVGGLQFNPVASSNAFWLTRPITRLQLLKVQLIHAYGLVFAPLMVGLTTGWLNAGFTGAQLLGASAEWFLYISFFATLGSTVAVHTRNIQGFFVLGGCTVGATLFLTATLEYLQRETGLLGDRPRWSGSSHASSVLVVMTVFVCAALMAWRLRMLTYRPVMSYGVLALAIVGMMLTMTLRPFDFLQAQPKSPKDLTISLVQGPKFAPSYKPGEQLLWSHFRVTGLASNMVAIPAQFHYGFNNGENFRLRGSYHGHYSYKTPIERIESSPSRHELIENLRRMYPEDTVWSGRRRGGRYESIPVGTKVKRWPKDLNGTFQGYLDAEILTIERVADLPMKNAFARASAGRAFAIKIVGDDNEGTQIKISDVRPDLTFTTDQDQRGNRSRDKHSLFLLYHEKSGEIFVLDSNSYRVGAPTFLNSQVVTTHTFHLPRSALRERLTGHVADGWLQGLRLHIYQASSLGLKRLDIDEEEYDFRTTRAIRNSDYAEAAQSGVDYLKSMKWPGTSDPQAAQAYAHDFMAHVPLNYYRNQGRDVTKLLTDIGPEVVPYLLREAPFPSSTAKVVMRNVLQRLIKNEHRKDVMEALLRDPSLAWICRSKRWGGDGHAALAKLLPGREKALPADALIMLSAVASPEQYEDLRWHAERCYSSQEFIFHNLRKLKGFPYEETVRAAWKRARLNLVSGYQLAPFAAEFGELDALHEFVRHITNNKSESRDRRAFEILADHFDTKGNQAELKAWLTSNAGKLRFDPTTNKYVL